MFLFVTTTSDTTTRLDFCSELYENGGKILRIGAVLPAIKNSRALGKILVTSREMAKVRSDGVVILTGGKVVQSQQLYTENPAES